MIIDTNPEFGVELACVIPYAYWLHTEGRLEKVITSKGMKPFYFFCDNVEEKYEQRSIDNRNNGVQNMPNTWNHHNAKALTGKDHSELTADEQYKVNGVLDYSKWKCPDYVSEFQKLNVNIDNKFVVISNRYNIEHGLPPTGYFDIECLYNIFNYFTENGYDVVYKRPRNTEFTIDNNEIQTLQNGIGDIIANVDGVGLMTDFDLCKHYENVHLFDDIVSKYPKLNYNEVQLALFSNATGFVSMGGGNGIFCSLFGKPNITYVTTSGELRPGYFDGDSYYKKLANSKIYPVIDPETEIKKRKYRDYSKIYKLLNVCLIK